MADKRQLQEARRYFVGGIVQGVGYRYFAMRAARRLGIGGYAKNLPDGRVEVYAAGTDAALGKFRAELARGPLGASVEGVVEEDAELNPEFTDKFSIEH